MADRRPLGRLPAPIKPTALPVVARAGPASSLYGAGSAVIGSGSPVAVALSPNGAQLAVQRPDDAVDVYDPATLTLRRTVREASYRRTPRCTAT